MQELKTDELKIVDGGFAIGLGTIIAIGFGLPFVAGFIDGFVNPFINN